MPYLTYAEYQTYKTGVAVTSAEYDTLYFYAEVAIDSYLGRHMTDIDEVFKKAVAIQIAMSQSSGGVAYYSTANATSEITSESVPDYSYSKAAKSKTEYTTASDVYGIFPIVAVMLTNYAVKAVDVIL